MAYDTALAQLTMNTSDNIPREFVPKKAINLVYGNIDFQDDIKEQTHVANGIITQNARLRCKTTHRVAFQTYSLNVRGLSGS